MTNGERSLVDPEKVTLAWLWERVPWQMWGSLVTLLAAALCVGVAVGNTTFVRELLGRDQQVASGRIADGRDEALGNSKDATAGGNSDDQQTASALHRAEQAEQKLVSLQTRVDQLDSCPPALLLGKLVGIGYAPSYSNLAEGLARDLRAAGATVTVEEIGADQLQRAAPNFGTLFYRTGELSEKAHATRRLLLSKFETEVKEGHWAYSPNDFAIWVGKRQAG